jgi:hypothetical protein
MELRKTAPRLHRSEKLLMVIAAIAMLAMTSGRAEVGSFRRGDGNGSGVLDISDGISILDFLFSGGQKVTCLDAADADDSGKVDISDAVGILQHIFQGARAPRPPFPDCGADPTSDGLSCASYGACAPATLLSPNTRVIGVSPHATDPMFVSLDAGQVVVVDPSGGKDVAVGDVIAGEIPRDAPGAELGFAFLRKVDRVTQVGATKVLQTSPATLEEAFDKLVLAEEIGFQNPVVRVDDLPVDLAPGAGGGAANALAGGGGSLHEFNWDGQFEIDERDGANYLRGVLSRARVRIRNDLVVFSLTYDNQGGISKMSAYSVDWVDCDLKFEIGGRWRWNSVRRNSGLGHKHVAIEESKVILVQDSATLVTVPLQVNARISYNVNWNVFVDGEAYADAGISYHSQVIPSFEWTADRALDTSGFAARSVFLDPPTPRIYVNGTASSDFQLDHGLTISTGLPTDAEEGFAANLWLYHTPEARLEMRGKQESITGSLVTDLCTEWDAAMRGYTEIRGSVGPSIGGGLYLNADWPAAVLESKSLSCGNAAGAPRAALQLSSLTDIPHFPANFTTHYAEFNASQSYDLDGGPIREYLWDFDGNGLVDQITTVPYAAFEYFNREFDCVLHVVDDEGAMGVARFSYPGSIPR